MFLHWKTWRSRGYINDRSVVWCATYLQLGWNTTTDFTSIICSSNRKVTDALGSLALGPLTLTKAAARSTPHYPLELFKSTSTNNVITLWAWPGTASILKLLVLVQSHNEIFIGDCLCCNFGCGSLHEHDMDMCVCVCDTIQVQLTGSYGGSPPRVHGFMMFYRVVVSSVFGTYVNYPATILWKQLICSSWVNPVLNGFTIFIS